MKLLPKVIATSVIRSVQQGESHGGIYLVDLESGDIKQMVDWNDASINWEGRGMDRGLRGIAFHAEYIYIAASDEIFVYDQQFNIIKSYRNQYLKNCHEIHISDSILYLTSTGYDSILLFDLSTETFMTGYTLRKTPDNRRLYFNFFDPKQAEGPTPGDSLHLNFITLSEGKLYVCGTILQIMAEIANANLSIGPPVPKGSHNTQPYMGGILTNDTKSDRIAWFDKNGNIRKSLPVPRFDESKLLMADIPEDHARQAFARGLCITQEGLIIGGSSPSTITVYDLEMEKILKSVNLTMDIRNSIHGLEIWPY